MPVSRKTDLQLEDNKEKYSQRWSCPVLTAEPAIKAMKSLLG